MKKVIIACKVITILLMSLFILTGCGDEEKNEVAGNKTEKKVTTNKVNETTNKESNKKSNVTGEAISDIDDDKYYFFTVNGKNYNAGDKIGGVQNSNLKVENAGSSDEEEIWASGFSVNYTNILNSKNNPIFSVMPYNITNSDVKVSEASIGGFELNESDYKKSSDTVEIYGGITIGTSIDEVEAIFGEPTSKSEGKGSTIEYKYKGNEKNHKFEFTFKDNKVQSIRWESFILN